MSTSMNKRDFLLAQKAIAARQVRSESKSPGSYSPMDSIKQKYAFPTASPTAFEKMSYFPKVTDGIRPSTTVATIKSHSDSITNVTLQEASELNVQSTFQLTPEQVKKQKLIEELTKSTLTPAVIISTRFSKNCLLI